jgi:DNA-binding MarR family transcriptional regulator
MTAAGWRVASTLGEAALTVPEIARRLGRRRQTVQVAVDDLVEAGYAMKRRNPRRASSPRIGLTSIGLAAFWDTVNRHTRWVNAYAKRFDRGDLMTTVNLLRNLGNVLEDGSS